MKIVIWYRGNSGMNVSYAELNVLNDDFQVKARL
jgi:hypothetical protein